MADDRHDELQVLIPALVSGQLSPGDRDRIEAHRGTCAECSQLVETATILSAALKSGGESLFSSHPEHSELREYMNGQSDHSENVAAHLKSCASCQLELSSMERRSTGLRLAGENAMQGKTRRFSFGLALAAGILLGMGVSAILLSWPSEPAGGRLESGLPTASGAAIYLSLTRSLDPQIVPLGEHEGFVALVVPVVMKPDWPDLERLIFEIQDESSRVWAVEEVARNLRLRAEDWATFIVPSRLLKPGMFTLRVRAASAEKDSYIIPFRIVRPQRNGG